MLFSAYPCRGAAIAENTVFRIISYLFFSDAASGSSMDWATGVAGIDWSFTLELRPGSTDPDPDQSYGFVLPAKYIIPTASEAWAGIKTVCENLIN